MKHSSGVSYQQQGLDFMKATKTGITTTFKTNDLYFPGDKEGRDVFKVTMITPRGRYTFYFGQSLKESTGDGGNPPTAYDIFATLTKYDPDTFEDFCANYGYDSDSRSAEKTYKAVCKEYAALCRLYTEDQLEEMREIN